MKKEVFWKNPSYKIGKPLRDIEESKYLIVGAGISGLTLAHFLIEGGVAPKDIAIVEASCVGGGSTGRSAGILIPEIETEKNLGWDDFLVEYGLRVAKAYRSGYLDALKTVEHLIRVGKIACDARKGDFLILARDEESRESVLRDIAARRALGERPRALRGKYLLHEFGSPGFVLAERDVRAISVNPLALSQGIGTYLRSRGVRIFENTPLLSTYGRTARFARGAISFGTIIYARGTGEVSPKLHNYITTIAVTEKLSKKQLEDLRLADLDLFIDEDGVRSYHYGKITGDGRLLLGYGDVRTSAHQAKTPLHAPHLRNIRAFLKSMFPETALEVAYAWSGVYAIGQEFIPVIRFKKHEVIVNGAGIQLGSVAAANYVAAKLLKKRHPLDRLFG